MSSPDVEAKYASLMQEREVLKEEHGQLREKLSQASLAQAVEAEQEGQVLVLIDPARAPTFPVEPNRAMPIFLGAILGLFGAFGSASLADATDVRVRGTRDLEALLGMTPMAAIPYIDGGRRGQASHRHPSGHRTGRDCRVRCVADHDALALTRGRRKKDTMSLIEQAIAAAKARRVEPDRTGRYRELPSAEPVALPVDLDAEPPPPCRRRRRNRLLPSTKRRSISRQCE